MFLYSLILLQRSRTVSDCLRTRILSRAMGGGPRTFPGGLNKWQWKRLHEKKAKEKEKRLLDQEKQLYQARVRSQIRAKLAGKPEEPGDSATHDPMSPKDQIKALADRFVKAGAEDLWNEHDGPLKTPPPNQRPGSVRGYQQPGSISSPLDVSRLILENRNLGSNSKNVMNSTNVKINGFGCGNVRDYSVQSERRFGRNGSSESKTDFSFDSKGVYLKKSSSSWESNHEEANNSSDENAYMRHGRSSMQRGRRFRRNENTSSSEDDGDSDFGEEEEGGVRRMTGSSAALGKYDRKITKRVPLKFVEEESSLSEVERIRKEMNERKMLRNEAEKRFEREKNEEDSVFSQKRFDECNISLLTLKALTAAGYVQMTRVQEATLSVSLEGKDALVKARTGTGKSAAFLLPAIETVLKPTTSNSRQRMHPISVLVLCPTRELASQIAAEAIAMLKFHEGIGVQTLIGGTRFKIDQKRLESDPCQIIVATPGRLLDHIENKSGLSVRLMGLKMLIVDEADHLLDLGFRKDMEKIVDCLPRQRQSLLFSATMPKEVRRVSQLVLKRDHVYVDTVGLGCIETPEKVNQSFMVAPHELHFQMVHHILKDHIFRTPDYKAIVFCSTGMVTSLMYLLLREMKMNVREIHSRKPQIYRTRISDEFRESKRLILVTSDVSARGMNYPDVTLVIQVGIPSDREQYIHRLGRTGREGKEGDGILLIAPWEEYFLDELKDLPLEKAALPYLDPDNRQKMEDSLTKIDISVKEAAYHAWLGYYNSISDIGRDKTTLVQLANKFCESIGLKTPPPLFRKTAIKMGLKDISGIRLRK
ncbi:DEA(D/H)-box RNA helicase family protein isoform 1 [Tripterygium wilfordii]|uniref:ATP-dependent RNA helicase n=1 Tax=Tripterygium wilfordii TaxID=458696 RepID=A0A7J7CKA5_TRIWF|nr:probable DEAD-box ATP-dependent RNA helicase 48 isoform X2 [Tripterygium wilfordii]KAF5734482.1 DEA(D/H)-box RNA helicase family protein isoform 1 [Tripterygium wilfordii]